MMSAMGEGRKRSSFFLLLFFFLPLLIKSNSLAVQIRKQSQWDDLAEVKD